MIRYFGAWCLLIAASLIPACAAGQIYELPNPVSMPGDYFGSAVAIGTRVALVGASGADLCGSNSGGAFVYEFQEDSGHWIHTATLTPDPCTEKSSFGRSVALFDSIAVITSYREAPISAQANAAYVFERQDGEWKQTARLSPATSFEEGAYASSVSIKNGLIAISTTGDTSGRTYGGAVYLYFRDGDGRWKLRQRISIDHNSRRGVFGGQAALGDGFLAVTAPAYSSKGKGSLHIFHEEDGEWRHHKAFAGLDDFVLSLDVGSETVVVGEKTDGDDQSGSATIFERDANGTWKRHQVLKPVDPFELGGFGTGVAVNGDLALVVGYDEQLRFEFNIDRVVYVFGKDPSAGYWRQRHIVDIGDVFFGTALDIADRVALIGRASDETIGQAVVVHLN